jgi:SAM-dependent methyltransferase
VKITLDEDAFMTLYCAALNDAHPDRAGADETRPESPGAKSPDVWFVPTPDDVVRAMLELARVRSDDVVVDLGSGDGRIAIAAAYDYGARAVGLELNADLLRQSSETSKQKGVSHLTTFVQEDLFSYDLREATVVTLYLLPDMNLQLRPKLLRELQPGARIVSHAFDMADWMPDCRAEVDGRYLYVWTINGRSAGQGISGTRALAEEPDPAQS